MAAISVGRAGVATAAFCDAVGRLYAGPGPLSNSNRVLPIGLAAAGTLPPDPPMITAVMSRQDERGAPVFKHSTASISDTSEPCALIRNAMTAQADNHVVIVVSAPATDLARVLDLQGIRDLIKAKVRAIVWCDGPVQDIPAARRVLAEWPSPVLYCSKEVGDAVLFPASSIEKDFAWSPAHPVVEAYRVSGKMPYDAPTLDMAAMFYAVRPDSGFFQLGEPGTLKIADNGAPLFTAGAASGASPHRALLVNASRKQDLLKLYIEIASAKPVVRPTGRGGPVKPAEIPKPPEAPKSPAAVSKPLP